MTLLSANNILGNIVSFQGNVKIKHKDILKKKRVVPKQAIVKGDLLVTSSDSVAVIKLVDGSRVVLDQKSTISFMAKNQLEQKNGKIFYKIVSREKKDRLKIKTNFAIIGIKGTTFIVSTRKDIDEQYVSLKEGLIGIESIKQDFKLYKQKVMNDYNRYKEKENSAFNKFKEQQENYIFEKRIKKFDLAQKRRASFDNNNVKEDLWGEKDQKDFSYFTTLLKNEK
jgi:hypothetical protein